MSSLRPPPNPKPQAPECENNRTECQCVRTCVDNVFPRSLSFTDTKAQNKGDRHALFRSLCLSAFLFVTQSLSQSHKTHTQTHSHTDTLTHSHSRTRTHTDTDTDTPTCMRLRMARSRCRRRACAPALPPGGPGSRCEGSEGCTGGPVQQNL